MFVDEQCLQIIRSVAALQMRLILRVTTVNYMMHCVTLPSVRRFLCAILFYATFWKKAQQQSSRKAHYQILYRVSRLGISLLKEAFLQHTVWTSYTMIWYMYFTLTLSLRCASVREWHEVLFVIGCEPKFWAAFTCGSSSSCPHLPTKPVAPKATESSRKNEICEDAIFERTVYINGFSVPFSGELGNFWRYSKIPTSRSSRAVALSTNRKRSPIPEIINSCFVNGD